MVDMLAMKRPTDVKNKESDHALVSKPSTQLLRAFTGAKGFMPTRRSEGHPFLALPFSHCHALPCPVWPCPSLLYLALPVHAAKLTGFAGERAKQFRLWFCLDPPIGAKLKP